MATQALTTHQLQVLRRSLQYLSNALTGTSESEVAPTLVEVQGPAPPPQPAAVPPPEPLPEPLPPSTTVRSAAPVVSVARPSLTEMARAATAEMLQAYPTSAAVPDPAVAEQGGSGFLRRLPWHQPAPTASAARTETPATVQSAAVSPSPVWVAADRTGLLQAYPIVESGSDQSGSGFLRRLPWHQALPSQAGQPVRARTSAEEVAPIRAVEVSRPASSMPLPVVDNASGMLQAYPLTESDSDQSGSGFLRRLPWHAAPQPAAPPTH